MDTMPFDPYTVFSIEHLRQVHLDLCANYREELAYQNEMIEHGRMVARVERRFAVPYGQTKKFYARLLRIVKEDVLLYKDLQRKNPSMREYFEGYLEMERKVKFVLKSFSSGDERKGYDIQAAKAYPMTSLLSFNAAGKASCIFDHEDRTPSMHYNEKRNSVHCFSCGRNADTIDVCQRLYSKSFGDAVRFLTNC